MREYNIGDNTGRVMCLLWMDHKTAEYWLLHYQTTYGFGKTPYPNGKGFYPDWGFRIIYRDKK